MEADQKAVDRFRRGYPRFSALISAHPAFRIFRRFTNIRARLILAKQAEISALEQQLYEIDRREPEARLLATVTGDTNKKRQEILSKLGAALSHLGRLSTQAAERHD